MNIKKPAASVLTLGILLILPLSSALGLPSFARQTGMPCAACHTIWPELNSFGRYFKLTGYVLSKTPGPFQFPPPLAATLQASYTRLNQALPRGYVESNWATHLSSPGNDVWGLPQGGGLYYGGRIFGKLGAFIQGTYDGAGNALMLDMTDIRYAGNVSLFGKKLIFGVTVNNSPTLQDVWNSTPAFGFPYAGPAVAPTPATGTIVAGALDQQVGGIGAYGLWNNLIYMGAALYHSAKTGLAVPLGAGNSIDTVVKGYAPYWRLVIQHEAGAHFFSAGTFGLKAEVYPPGETSGPADGFTDGALDTQYQYRGAKHLVSAHAHWIHESRQLGASFALGNASSASGHLDALSVHGHYYYRSSVGDAGVSLAYFSTTGNPDRLLYLPGPVDGSANGFPHSHGFILEGDFVFMNHLKLSLQYWIYTAFNGAIVNYDGFGREAAGNNTLYVLLWFML
jgi:hypothetical protein